ncbi:hypothetical protein EV143_1253 [Flavobacterium chryseum]|uniref:hypothetical protein n=1 Tax=Flavobacterium sp. P3160 TaxID=2512113 RepID=UPI00105EA010|nr:hypothetical protein [Flavobacterium sp. P3160]TDO67870.1 hypothetical protein EV143_1253 [Flavobacterium sp. P3160]
MKKNILILLLALNLNLYSQNKVDDYKKLIDSTIVIKSIETYKGFQEELNKKNETDNWKRHIEDYRHHIENIYLVDENHNPYVMSSSQGTDLKFKQIDIYNKKNKKLLKEGIDVWKIIPTLDSNKLKIIIIEFKVTYSKNKYQFSNGGGTTTLFEYSCAEKKWILVNSNTIAP